MMWLWKAFRRVLAIGIHSATGRPILRFIVFLLLIGAAGLKKSRTKGANYEGMVYFGEYQLKNGEKFLFYVVSRRGFVGPDQSDQVYFVFTVGADGKIIQIQ